VAFIPMAGSVLDHVGEQNIDENADQALEAQTAAGGSRADA
jgi:hypothetical protein